MAVTVAIFLNFGEFGLDFAHKAGLVELALDERPKANLNQNSEKNNSETKIANKTINNKEDVRNRTNNYHVN